MKMKSYIGIFILCFATLSFVNGDGHCVMRGSCEVDDVTLLTRPCVYNGTAIPLNDTNAIEILTNLCPNLKPGANFSTCCDSDQVALFQEQFAAMAALFQRCPSCYHNLANVFCQSTCSPNQSDFMEVVSSTPYEDEETVTEMNYYISRTYTQGVFDSCSNVQMSTTSDKAISLMCGGHASCNPYYLFQFIGGHDPSPYQTNYINETADVITNETIFHPMNDTIIPCSEPVGPGGTACSCVDCPCDPQPPPEPSKPKFLWGLPILQTVMIIVFLILAILIIGGFACKCWRQRNEEDELLISDDFNQESESICNRWGSQLDMWLKNVFTQLGVYCASHPYIVICTSLLFFGIFSSGLAFFTVRTDPVELWSASHSQAREEKNYFDEHFGPFYRTEQVIITRKSKTPVVGTNLTFSSSFDRDYLRQILELQNSITALTAKIGNRTIYFEDICFAPVNKGKCMIQSAVNWFQNDINNLNYYKDIDIYLQYLHNCTSNPYYIQKKGLSCLGEYGGPVFPYVALGGVDDKNYANASALILTFMVQNHVNKEANNDAMAWEEKFVEFMKNFSNPDMEFAFTSERSIQDELNRESESDISTILISYLVMFAYVSITLGQYESFGLLFVKSKLLLGLSGVVIVLASVISSLGIFSYFGVPATLIIIEVIPFLVLAVGVDNIFILVQRYQRSQRSSLETREQHIGRIVGEVSPSIFLASLAESSCFFLGALSHMPAVHVFAFYSGLALLIDFVLQITCFVAILSLDAAREESGRFDICCCVKTPVSENSKVQNRGFLYKLFDDYYAPFLMKDVVRCIVVLIFSGWLCFSISVLPNIDVGLDQKLSMPEDSYVLNYFKYLEKYLSVGPPVYFVVKSGFDYSNVDDQNGLCSVAYCHRESLMTQISDASLFDNRTYIAVPPMDWLDSFISWSNNGVGCCRVYANSTREFCPSTEADKHKCGPCNIVDSHLRPQPEKFHEFLTYFMNENPTVECPVAGHAGFASALEINNETIGATHYMTYHTILKTSQDFTEALRSARLIAANITETLSIMDIAKGKVEVFPYSIFYVFYEQYLTVTHDAIKSILVSLVDIFIVTLFLMGLDFHSAVIMVLTILMILHDLMGLMYLWNISMNAVALVNLVMAVGISVEFCSHIIRSFAFNREGSRVDRARSAVASMGSSVLSGITLTKFGGIVVLAFSKSQIFQVFYFRMYLGIVLIGAAHGLIFLPVFLSIVGPPVKHKFDTSTRGKPLKVSSIREEKFDSEVTSLN